MLRRQLFLIVSLGLSAPCFAGSKVIGGDDGSTESERYLYKTQWCEGLLADLNYRSKTSPTDGLSMERFIAFQIDHREVGITLELYKSISHVQVKGTAIQALGANVKVPVKVVPARSNSPLGKLGFFLKVEPRPTDDSIVADLARTSLQNGWLGYLFIITPKAGEEDAATYVARASGIVESLAKQFPFLGEHPLQVRTPVQLRETGLIGALLFARQGLVEEPQL